MQERIGRADALDETAMRTPQHAREDLRERLERLPGGHPSSDYYGDADLIRRAGPPGSHPTDTNREDATGAHTDREEATGTRTDASRDTTERAGSGWDAPDVRDRPDRPAEEDIQLPADRGQHILDGDGDGEPGGGHRHGTNKPGKTEFPANWPDTVILPVVEEVTRNPDSVERQRNGSWLATGERDGVRVTSVVLADGRIWTAWPEPGGAGVRQNPTEGAA